MDHMSTWAWSAAMATVGPAAVSTTHNRCEGRAYGVHAASKTSPRAALTSCPGAISCSRHAPGPTSTARSWGPSPGSPGRKTVRRVWCRAMTSSQASLSRSRGTGRGRVKVRAIQDPGRSPAPTWRC